MKKLPKVTTKTLVKRTEKYIAENIKKVPLELLHMLVAEGSLIAEFTDEWVDPSDAEPYALLTLETKLMSNGEVRIFSAGDDYHAEWRVKKLADLSPEFMDKYPEGNAGYHDGTYEWDDGGEEEAHAPTKWFTGVPKPELLPSGKAWLLWSLPKGRVWCHATEPKNGRVTGTLYREKGGAIVGEDFIDIKIKDDGSFTLGKFRFKFEMEAK